MSAKSEADGQLQLGKLYRDQGVARVTRGADADYRVAIDEAILECARSGEPFTVDKVRRMVGDPPEGQSPNIIGARFLGAASRKPPWIERISDDNSRRKERHAGRVGVWIGVLPTAPKTLEATA